MKKTIARLILAGWVVVILGVLTILAMYSPALFIFSLSFILLIAFATSIPWAIEVLGEDQYYD
jgi:hypothetical protein